MANKTRTLKCGHEVFNSELCKSEGIVMIKWNCVNGCETEWVIVGEAPEPDECEMEYVEPDQKDLDSEANSNFMKDAL